MNNKVGFILNWVHSFPMKDRSALSPYLFPLVMDVHTRHLQEDVPWCMLFADYDKAREHVHEKLEL